MLCRNLSLTNKEVFTPPTLHFRYKFQTLAHKRKGPRHTTSVLTLQGCKRLRSSSQSSTSNAQISRREAAR
jgi:hypothetical protein